MTEFASQFDIVIPLGPNDISTIQTNITYTSKNVVGYRHIYVISYDPGIVLSGCIVIQEDIFPFSKESVRKILTEATQTDSGTRTGWYLQQLLKLYAPLIIPGILANVLVIDADTFFTQPTTFFENGLPLYNLGNDCHEPYFHHMRQLHTSLIKNNPYSGICHHMMFQTNILQEMFHLVESTHHEPFYQTFFKKVRAIDVLLLGASEYEIYFHYLFIYHPNEFKIRLLKWENTQEWADAETHNYISRHWYMR